MKKFFKEYRNCFLAFVLIAGLVFTSVMIPGVRAQEDADVQTLSEEELPEEATEEVADTAEPAEAVENVQSETGDNTELTVSEDFADDTQGEEDSVDISEEAPEESAVTEDGSEDAEIVFDSLDEGDAVTYETEETDDCPFTITSAKIDGVDLTTENATIASWSGKATKTLQLQINKNSNASIDSTKKYILSMKVVDTLYFSGLPKAGDITGVEQVAMIQNSVPKLNMSNGKPAAYSSFSQYSGEIRMELNTAVETITVPDVGINYDVQLIGYTGATQTIQNPIEISLISVDKGTALDAVEEQHVLEKCGVSAANITTGTASGAGLRNYMSTKGFSKESVVEQEVTLGKNDKISYAGGAAGAPVQVYKTLTIQFNCPYIEVDGKTYYLEFKEGDSEWKANKQGSTSGYAVSEDATYNAENHTITYKFKDIYLGDYTAIFYTPQFSWPSELADKEISPDTTYQIKGCDWTVTEQTGYTGAKATLKNSYEPTKYAYFIPDAANIRIISSNASTDSDGIAKRYIYKGMTPENGHTGALGFFDIHNMGATDTTDVKITFTFNNTNSSGGATYYVERVNLPVMPSRSIAVSYTLTNGVNTVSGTQNYTPGDKVQKCLASLLRTNSSVDNTYYIKELSYTTVLEKNTIYHAETAHLNRNRIADGGLFLGYIDGAVGTTASAQLEISAVDGTTSIANDKSQITSTEISYVAEDDYIAYSLSAMTINKVASHSITAGNSTTVTFGVTVSDEEYHAPKTTKVNGYHVFRDGIFYMCLPEGVSISGTAQVTITHNGKESHPQKVEELDDTKCTVDGVTAYWWQITADGINADGTNVDGKSFSVSVQLATKELMQGMTWDFANCVAVKLKNQSVSWGAAGKVNTVCNSVSEMEQTANNVGTKKDAINVLANAIRKSGQTNEIGLNLYNATTNAKLTIARAEARLDVNTNLTLAEGEKNTSVQMTSSEAEAVYHVKISSNDGGYAENFNYYIPIVKSNSVIDSESMVATKEFSMCLQHAVDIKNTENGVNTDAFTVSYTTSEDLNSTNIRGGNVVWQEATDGMDFSKVTAVRISTKDGSTIASGSAYEFDLSLKYDNSSDDFESMAGSKVQWRSFGRYTYKRGEAGETTNTYPSNINTITLGYVCDLRETPIKLAINTGADNNYISSAYQFTQSEKLFKKAQNIKIKNVTVSTGTELTDSEPINLTGTDANTKFRVAFNINNQENNAVSLKSWQNHSWEIEANSLDKLQAMVYFSKALTDSVTDRYIDVELGNDNIDITCRIVLNRTVAAVSATNSGISAGRNYQVPQFDNACKISQKSAVTGVFIINNFVPGNYTGLELSLKQDKSTGAFPKGTSITMMKVTEGGTATDYWHYEVGTGTNTIALSSFKRMGGTDAYTYGTDTSGSTYRRMFVVDFGGCDTGLGTGDYSLELSAEAKSGITGNIFKSALLKFAVAAKATYTLTAVAEDESDSPESEVSYGIAKSEGNDSYLEGKSLALVMTAENGQNLPADFTITAGDKKYQANRNGVFVIPLGTIQNGSLTLCSNSQMFPDEEVTYKFTGSLYLSNSTVAAATMNGQNVAETEIEFTKAEKIRPAINISGTQTASVAEWITGQDMQFSVKNIPSDGSVTVTAYKGLEGIQKATDLLSSVGGIFDISNGIGTYNPQNTSTGKLVLSNAATSGTYRLLFEVKDAGENTVLSVPYYIVVE